MDCCASFEAGPTAGQLAAAVTPSVRWSAGREKGYSSVAGITKDSQPVRVVLKVVVENRGTEMVAVQVTL